MSGPAHPTLDREPVGNRPFGACDPAPLKQALKAPDADIVSGVSGIGLSAPTEHERAVL